MTWYPNIIQRFDPEPGEWLDPGQLVVLMTYRGRVHRVFVRFDENADAWYEAQDGGQRSWKSVYNNYVHLEGAEWYVIGYSGHPMQGRYESFGEEAPDPIPMPEPTPAPGCWVVHHSDYSGTPMVFPDGDQGELNARRYAMDFHMEVQRVEYGQPWRR